MPRDTQPMAGRYCLVTGGAAGLSLAVTRGLAALGARVFLVGRSEAIGAPAVASVIQETGNPHVTLWQADLSLQAEVRRLADRALAELPRLDVLVNALCARYSHRRESADGIEMTLAVNHLAPFLLTQLLLDLCRASAPMRIIGLASAEARGPLSADALLSRDAYRSPDAHGRARLANLLATLELARRLAGSGITVNAVDPGRFSIDQDCDESTWAQVAQRLRALGDDRPAEAARTVVALASEARFQETTGRLFARDAEVPLTASAANTAAAREVWRLAAGWTRVPAVG